MQSKYLVICDQEEGYASAFADYIMRKKELSFQVHTCSNISYVLSLQKQRKIDYLFISAEYPEEMRRQAEAEKIFVLAGDKNARILENETMVYKYQSGDSLMGELIRQCNEKGETQGSFLKTVKKKQGRIIGVYSPVHRIGKTTYALNMGEELAVHSNVLYLSMETYGGVGEHFSEGGQTLSDVLYYAKQEKGNIGLTLTTLVRRRNHLDYVAPVQVSEDLKAVSKEEWSSLIHRIMEESIYEILILDLDDGVRNVYDVLELCTEIHMPVTDDAVSLSKIRQFEEELTLLGKEALHRKIIRKEQKV